MNKDEMDCEAKCDDRLKCWRCGGTGVVEYHDAIDVCDDKEFLGGFSIITLCPACGGTGTVIGGLEVKR